MRHWKKTQKSGCSGVDAQSPESQHSTETRTRRAAKGRGSPGSRGRGSSASTATSWPNPRVIPALFLSLPISLVWPEVRSVSTVLALPQLQHLHRDG